MRVFTDRAGYVGGAVRVRYAARSSAAVFRRSQISDCNPGPRKRGLSLIQSLPVDRRQYGDDVCRHIHVQRDGALTSDASLAAYANLPGEHRVGTWYSVYSPGRSVCDRQVLGKDKTVISRSTDLHGDHPCWLPNRAALASAAERLTLLT